MLRQLGNDADGDVRFFAALPVGSVPSGGDDHHGGKILCTGRGEQGP